MHTHLKTHLQLRSNRYHSVKESLLGPKKEAKAEVNILATLSGKGGYEWARFKVTCGDSQGHL